MSPTLQLGGGAILPGMPETRNATAREPREHYHAWVAAMAKGDETALNALYEATLPRVYGLALRVTGRREVAEDVVIEVYWQAWREAGRFDATRGEPMAWLYMICRTRALDALRRRDDAEPHPEPETLVGADPSTAQTLLDALSTAQTEAALAAAITRLTPVQRQMISLAFYRGLSHQEIAVHTGLPLGTVKSHLKRAQDALRNDLGVHH